MKKVIVMICLFMLLPWLTSSTDAQDVERKISFLVKSSSQSLFQSVLTVESDQLIQSLIHSKSLDVVTDLPHSNNYILIEDANGIRTLLVDEIGEIYDLYRKEKLQLSASTAKKIKTYFKVLAGKHFGELTNWEEVDKRIPKYSLFKITDLETGSSFYAQRRAGKSHADVQPLTIHDTRIMKKIFEGEWSWKRRAILVHVNEDTFAASMHGMPHGGGALANGFPGHFCIHFKGSVTHKTKMSDLSHQVMVNKAGGVLNQFVSQLNAKEVTELFFISLNQKDLDLLKLIYSGDVRALQNKVEQIESVRMITKEPMPTINGTLVFELPITYKMKEKDKAEVEKTYVFKVTRDAPTGRWRLHDVPL
ncbi:hypothetical protein AWH56_012825 [Anaerobacillus isosaccharinicus]|uniref:Uncharacterized protein n=1 Tax=Anaerobacillus isosaccharinicus TaxID=1532552 RepID=A0A1S2M5F7_9BACI|nr:hypothetical protein [Anaerobacillus isosaccharinicus]MBA5588222.1 hypothetical protein [Anaerobacillus isosaccharinicus]QOY38330.1 hypothetical protein AWH56_012825 [Anaerobacillus isosaccharinicus]